MNKNQLTVLLLVFIFFVCAIFLYFVFRSSMQENVVDENEGVETVFDLDEIVTSENESSDNEIINQIESETVVENTEIKSVSTIAETKSYESPETGPGLVAAVIAFLFSGIFAILFYKRSKQSEIFVN